MQIPLQISCENAELSEAIRATIEREVDGWSNINTTSPDVVLASSGRARSIDMVPYIGSIFG